MLNAQGKILLYEIFQIFDLQLLFTSLPIRFLLIKYVGLIVFTVFSLKYGLLYAYELVVFRPIFMILTLPLVLNMNL